MWAHSVLRCFVRAVPTPGGWMLAGCSSRGWGSWLEVSAWQRWGDRSDWCQRIAGWSPLGAYRFLRHPLYASYLLAGLGYLVQSPRLWNVAVLIVVWACQVARMVGEEKLLGTERPTVRTRYKPGGA